MKAKKEVTEALKKCGMPKDNIIADLEAILEVLDDNEITEDNTGIMMDHLFEFINSFKAFFTSPDWSNPAEVEAHKAMFNSPKDSKKEDKNETNS